MKTINACDVRPTSRAWVWTDAGDGKLYPINYWRPDGWLVCGLSRHGDYLTVSFCVCDDSPCYVFATEDERKAYEAERRQQLADTRARWAEEARERRICWQVADALDLLDVVHDPVEDVYLGRPRDRGPGICLAYTLDELEQLARDRTAARV